MFSFQSVNGAKIVNLENYQKNGNLKKNDYLLQNDVFFSEYLKFSTFSQNNDLSQTQPCKFHFLRGKRHKDMARKRGQLYKRLKLPRRFPIDRD